MADEISELQADIRTLTGNLVKVEKAIIRMEAKDAHSESACPYRVQIARNENGIKEARSDAREALSLAQNNRVQIAQLIASGFAGGGLVAVVQAIITFVR